MPSKKVFLKRCKPFVHEQITSEAAKEQLAFTKRGVGGYYATKNSTRMGSGLTDEEIKLLLPQILSVPSTDTGFRKEVERFFIEINTQVPFDRGLELEVGLELDNDKPVTYIEEDENGKVKAHNMPINIDDYIKYRHAMCHPDVAPSPEAAKGNRLMQYYIEDPTETLRTKVGNSDDADKAMAAWAQIKNDGDKVTMLLTLLRQYAPKKNGVAIQPFFMSPDEQIVTLRGIVMDKPKEFTKAASDENLKRRYYVDEMITVGLLKRIGTTVIHVESNEPLGETMDEVVAILWSAGKSQLLSELQRQYKEKRKRA